MGLQTIFINALNASRCISRPRRKVRRAVEEPESYKVVFLGGSAVGKTSIIKRHFYDKHNYSHSITIEDLYKEKITVENVQLEMDIIDTSGSEHLPALRRQAIQKADAIVIVYALDDADSFMELLNQLHEVMKLRNPMPSVVIVGNKADVCTLDEKERQKRRDYFMNELDLFYVECSAREGTNVNEVFEKQLFTELFTSQSDKKKSKRGSFQQSKPFFRKLKKRFSSLRRS
ncbi:ras-like protein 2 [Lineus longissimus]|uniref:ras-like protein 2 n=1 Tax=Lineus longissimus TaxID=88925 RepID=UPI00315D3837